MSKVLGSTLRTLGQGKHGDGNGLYLQVKGGSRSWLFRYTRGGHERWIGIGPLKTVSLAQARSVALEYRNRVSQGQDPRPKPDPIITTVLMPPTFGTACLGYFTARSADWRSAKYEMDWFMCMERHVAPRIGHIPVADIDTDAVLSVVIDPSRARSVLDLTLRRRLASVLDYAKARGWRQGENPARLAGHLEYLMPRKRKPVEHHAALPYQRLHNFVDALKARRAITRDPLLFLILTGARAGEVQLAQWDEIDLAARVWTVPAERSKTNKLHRIPLSGRALECLGGHWEGRSPWVFPGANSDNSLNPSSLHAMMKRMGYGQYTVHGFRSTFRDWVADKTDYPGELAEIALGHSVAGAVERAYRRGDQLEKRRALMEDWARYCYGSSD